MRRDPACGRCASRCFAQTPERVRLRFYQDDGAPAFADRELDRSEVERWAQEVEADYAKMAPDLLGLGRRLARWLDGDTERWLAGALDGVPGLAVHVDVEEKLRHLPWELLAAGLGDGFLCGRPEAPFTPVRRVVAARSYPVTDPANRPLRLLFLAASPLDVQPVLDFEAEEARILEATRRTFLDLEVEESGSLSGLREQLVRFGCGHFDVLHLSGHATLQDEKPVFYL